MSADPIRALQDRLIEAALPHAAFDGWGERALAAAAKGLGLGRADARRAFPGGRREIVAHLSDWADRRMLALLGRRDLESMRVRERVQAAVRARLEALAPHREAARRALAWLALPGNAPLAARLTWRTVDAMWYACGDTATDVNYYTKRALLAGVYASTALCWVADASEGQAETWAFLERRIADAMAVPGLGRRLCEAADRVPTPLGIWRARRAPHGR